MPKLPLPPEVDAMLRKANPAVIATVRADGTPHTAATWYEWDGSRILVNMDATRLRLRNLRHDPRVSLTVLDAGSWYRQVTVYGHAVEIADDPELEGINRLSRRYTQQDFNPLPGRTRVNAWIELEGWYGWENAGAWPSD